MGKKDSKKWHAQLMHQHKKHYGGLFDNEEDAAMSVNLLCDDYEVERKNPKINLKLFEAYQVQNSISQYIGVSWIRERKKWRARLPHKGKKYSAGLFDNEKHAAMKVNLLCDKFGIQRKNPTSKYIGVCWVTREKKWQAQLTIKRYTLEE